MSVIAQQPIHVFDKALQEANRRLREIGAELRDRLPPPEAAHLAAQLPTLECLRRELDPVQGPAGEL
jgi:uncharacterized protein (DUF2267 family)